MTRKTVSARAAAVSKRLGKTTRSKSGPAKKTVKVSPTGGRRRIGIKAKAKW